MPKRWIVVAGASRGIGAETVLLLLKKGYQVVAASRNVRMLEEKIHDVQSDNIKYIPFDFSEIERLPFFVEEVTKYTGGISGLLYAAGKQKTLPLSLSKFSSMQDLFLINAFSAFELVRLFSQKGAYSAQGASFVLLSSLAAHEGALGKALYGASKGALEGFIPAAAAELARKNLRLNALTLGIIQTDMSKEFLDKMTEEQIKNVQNSYPLGLGTPLDAASFIEYLISDNARWITGQAFVIDGGHLVRSS